jgi:hypothetical protein
VVFLVSCSAGSEATGSLASLASPRVAKVPNQPTGRSFMGNVMDTLMLKNSFRRTSISVEPVLQNTHQVNLVLEFIMSHVL